MDQAKKDLTEATNFVREKHLVMLSSTRQPASDPNARVHARHLFCGRASIAAPALEPQLGAFYWVTPIPPDWPKARVESKLREYNQLRPDGDHHP